MAGTPWRIRVEYPGGPSWQARVVDAGTGEVLEGVSWCVDARAHEAPPQLLVVMNGRTLRFALDSFECEAEAVE